MSASRHRIKNVLVQGAVTEGRLNALMDVVCLNLSDEKMKNSSAEPTFFLVTCTDHTPMATAYSQNPHLTGRRHMQVASLQGTPSAPDAFNNEVSAFLEKKRHIALVFDESCWIDNVPPQMRQKWNDDIRVVVKRADEIHVPMFTLCSQVSQVNSSILQRTQRVVHQYMMGGISKCTEIEDVSDEVGTNDAASSSSQDLGIKARLAAMNMD